MILRKPYAILIKFFRSIHIIMFVFFVYLIFALRKIYIFFSSYIKTSTYVYRENMANIYVPWILFLIVVLLLVFAISIFALMRKKEKPVLFYKIMIIYSFLVLVSLIYFLIFFKSLDNTVYETLRIVINRDISLALYLVNFFFVFFSFIRGFGFDIKKFSFDKDKKELHLEDSDNEEYELNVGIEKDDIKSFVNKQKREFGYYLKENKLILTIILLIIITFGGFYLYYNYFVVNKIYNEKDRLTINGVNYRIDNSYISDIDKYGQIINPNDDYLIVNMNITNDTSARYLDQETFRVNINDEYYYPAVSSCESFSDMGLCYNNQELKSRESINYIMVYKIPKVYKEIFLEILKGKGKEYSYSKIKLDYVKNTIQDVNLNDNAFEINEKKYSINKYELMDKAFYLYEECISNVCNSYKRTVMPNTGGKILTLEFSELDSLSDDFLNSAIGVKYNDIIYSGKDIKLIAKNNNTVYYSVPSFLNENTKFILLISTRKIRYNISLGGK